MGKSYKRFHYYGTRDTWSFSRRPMGETMRELNARPEYTDDRRVRLLVSHGEYFVKFPPLGLDDGMLLGPDGLPDNIGPTLVGPAPWSKPEEALAHFHAIGQNLIRLHIGEPIRRVK